MDAINLLGIWPNFPQVEGSPEPEPEVQPEVEVEGGAGTPDGGSVSPSFKPKAKGKTLQGAASVILPEMSFPAAVGEITVSGSAAGRFAGAMAFADGLVYCERKLGTASMRTGPALAGSAERGTRHNPELAMALGMSDVPEVY